MKRFCNIFVLSITTLFFIQCTTRTTFEKVLINSSNSAITILSYKGTETIDRGSTIKPGESVVLYRTSVPGKNILGACAELPLEIEIDVAGHCMDKDHSNSDNWDLIPVGKALDLSKIRLWQCAFQIQQSDLRTHAQCQETYVVKEKSDVFDD